MDRMRSVANAEQFRTYRRSRAVRLTDFDYAADEVMHLIICSADSVRLTEPTLGKSITENIVHYCRELAYELYGYCLMPDHLHVLLSPGGSGVAIAQWLKRFKSYTTNEYHKRGGNARLWQRSAYDHVCRAHESAETVLAYIVENPLRAGLVDDWKEWPWTGVFVDN